MYICIYIYIYVYTYQFIIDGDVVLILRYPAIFPALLDRRFHAVADCGAPAERGDPEPSLEVGEGPAKPIGSHGKT